MKWISVKEKLPDNYQKVIVGREGHKNVIKIITYRNHFGDKHWGDTVESHFAYPTHWMPLPEPPQIPE